jgi:hypothetical protein
MRMARTGSMGVLRRSAGRRFAARPPGIRQV